MAVKRATILLFLVFTTFEARNVHIFNRCNFPIWPAWKDVSGFLKYPAKGGAYLAENQSVYIDCLENSRYHIWARTSCNKNFNCETGSCGKSLYCNSNWTESGPGVVEIAFNMKKPDVYDISFVDGFNVPVVLKPIKGSGDCRPIGTHNWATLGNCPDPLTVYKNDRRILCLNPCTKFGTDEYCCTGHNNTQETCGSTPYAVYFKDLCPNCRTYKFDNATFTCRNPSYNVFYC